MTDGILANLTADDLQALGVSSNRTPENLNIYPPYTAPWTIPQSPTWPPQPWQPLGPGVAPGAPLPTRTTESTNLEFTVETKDAKIERLERELARRDAGRDARVAELQDEVADLQETTGRLLSLLEQAFALISHLQETA